MRLEGAAASSTQRSRRQLVMTSGRMSKVSSFWATEGAAVAGPCLCLPNFLRPTPVLAAGLTAVEAASGGGIGGSIGGGSRVVSTEAGDVHTMAAHASTRTTSTAYSAVHVHGCWNCRPSAGSMKAG